MRRKEIRIAGAGGQGVVTAGRILAEAAILSGSSATQTQVYGPESRGGASRSDVVIASGSIGFPLVDAIDVLVTLSPEAYERYRPALGEHGRLIVDSRCPPTNGDADRFPVVDTARAVSGGQLLTGVVALGVVQGVAGVVDREALRRAVESRVPTRHLAANLEALRAGLRLVEGVER